MIAIWSHCSSLYLPLPASSRYGLIVKNILKLSTSQPQIVSAFPNNNKNAEMIFVFRSSHVVSPRSTR